PHRTDTMITKSCNWLGGVVMGKVLFSLAFATALLGVASSEASAASFVCQAVGPRSVGYGRAYFVADAKWQALIRCERRSEICIISYCGLTPYAAIQAQTFRTPSYSETDTNGGGFALSYDGRTAGNTRTELGGRFDHLLLAGADAVLAFRARAAWAPDWVSDPILSAVFQTLPGSNFTVDGALPTKNSALTSAGAELRLVNGITLL